MWFRLGSVSNALRPISRLDSNIIRRSFYLSLERAVGQQTGADEKLIASGQFHAYVTPDLPEAADIDLSAISDYAPPGMLNVRTVAAQVIFDFQLFLLKCSSTHEHADLIAFFCEQKLLIDQSRLPLESSF